MANIIFYVVYALGKTICNPSVIKVILFVETYVHEKYFGFVLHKGRPTATTNGNRNDAKSNLSQTLL